MTAATKLEAKIASYDLDELTSILVGLGQRVYAADVAIATRAVIASIEARFPDVDGAVWELLDREIPGVDTYAAALLLVREELAA